MHGTAPIRFVKNLWLSGVAALLILGACGREAQVDVPEAEITAEVVELDAVHEVMYPLWHDAFPNKDYATIGELIPQFEPLMANLEAAELPGILRHKATVWEEGMIRLVAVYDDLKMAVSEGDASGMLAHTEGFHSAYEALVRTIRPLVAELEAFHQELYKVYHYYLPEGDMASLTTSARVLSERAEPLLTVELPARLAERQEEFSAAAVDLNAAVAALVEALANDDREAVSAAVERVHTAYGVAEKIFG